MDAELQAVGAAAAVEAGGLDPDLLGGYLTRLDAVARDGGRLGDAALADCRAAGGRAADAGVPLRALVDLYLSATWRAWRTLPAVRDAPTDEGLPAVGEAVLRAADDAVAAVAEGYQNARRWVIRREEAIRREFVDDLLSGAGDPAQLLVRADQFGLDLAAPHAVLVAGAAQPFRDATPVLGRIERAASQAVGDGLLVTSKDGRLVCVLPAGSTAGIGTAVDAIAAVLDRSVAAAPVPPAAVPPADGTVGDGTVGDGTAGDVPHADGPRGDDRGTPTWRAGVGRAYPGSGGVRRSYQEAQEAAGLADRLRLRPRVVHAADLLVYRVLLRDREAITDLIGTVLGPLEQARGGSGPLLATLAAYLTAGSNTTATARAMHLSVRAVTYRLARIRDLTGHDPTDPQQRYVLHTAWLGRRLLGPRVEP